MTLRAAAVLRPGDWVRLRRWRAPGGRAGRHVGAAAFERRRGAGGAGRASDGRAGLRGDRRGAVRRRWSRSGCSTACRRRCSTRRASGSATSWRWRPGCRPTSQPGAAPRPGYDPAHDDADAARGKPRRPSSGRASARCSADGPATPRQGLWGLVDQRAVRAWEATGRADARLVAAIREVIDAETRRLDRDPVAADPPGDQGGGGHARARGGAAAGPEHVLQAGRRAVDRPAHVRLGGHPPADREPAGRAVHADVRGPAGRAGADRLHPDRRDGAAGRRGAGPRGSDHRGRRRDPHDLRGGAAPGRHQGGRRGAAAGPDAGARNRCGRAGRPRCGCRRRGCRTPGWWTSTPGWSSRRPGR